MAPEKLKLFLLRYKFTKSALKPADIKVIKRMCLKFLLFKGLALVCPKEKPNKFSKAKDKGTDITLIKLGMSIEKGYIPGLIT